MSDSTAKFGKQLFVGKKLDSEIVRNFECLKLLQYNSIINIIASYTFVFGIG